MAVGEIMQLELITPDETHTGAGWVRGVHDAQMYLIPFIRCKNGHFFSLVNSLLLDGTVIGEVRCPACRWTKVIRLSGYTRH
jgi:hypothetical protein